MQMRLKQDMARPQPVQVLLVEADPVDARRIIQMLRVNREKDFRSKHVRRFSEAQHRLETCGADVLLADLCLPDARGIEVISAAQRIAPGVPLIAVTRIYELLNSRK